MDEPSKIIGKCVQLIGLLMGIFGIANKSMALSGIGTFVALLGRAIDEYEWFD